VVIFRANEKTSLDKLMLSAMLSSIRPLGKGPKEDFDVGVVSMSPIPCLLVPLPMSCDCAVQEKGLVMVVCLFALRFAPSSLGDLPPLICTYSPALVVVA
jgi:hypothetical protein